MRYVICLLLLYFKHFHRLSFIVGRVLFIIANILITIIVFIFIYFILHIGIKVRIILIVGCAAGGIGILLLHGRMV